ncbi:hypothetical protein NDU88_008615, partial [Pleurodeles waltl]
LLLLVHRLCRGSCPAAVEMYGGYLGRIMPPGDSGGRGRGPSPIPQYLQPAVSASILATTSLVPLVAGVLPFLQCSPPLPRPLPTLCAVRAGADPPRGGY